MNFALLLAEFILFVFNPAQSCSGVSNVLQKHFKKSQDFWNHKNEEPKTTVTTTTTVYPELSHPIHRLTKEEEKSIEDMLEEFEKAEELYHYNETTTVSPSIKPKGGHENLHARVRFWMDPYGDNNKILSLDDEFIQSLGYDYKYFPTAFMKDFYWVEYSGNGEMIIRLMELLEKSFLFKKYNMGLKLNGIIIKADNDFRPVTLYRDQPFSEIWLDLQKLTEESSWRNFGTFLSSFFSKAPELTKFNLESASDYSHLPSEVWAYLPQTVDSLGLFKNVFSEPLRTALMDSFIESKGNKLTIAYDRLSWRTAVNLVRSFGVNRERSRKEFELNLKDETGDPAIFKQVLTGIHDDSRIHDLVFFNFDLTLDYILELVQLLEKKKIPNVHCLTGVKISKDGWRLLEGARKSSRNHLNYFDCTHTHEDKI